MATPSTPDILNAVQFGSSVDILINRESNSYTHTLYALLYTNGGQSREFVAQTTGERVEWTPPLDLVQYIPNATSLQAQIVCETYSSGAMIGTRSSNVFTISVPEDIKPVVESFAAEPVSDSVPSAWGLYVKGFSQARLTTVARGQYGATIQTYYVSGSKGLQISGASGSVTTGVLNEVGAYAVTVVVKDSRGRFAAKALSFTVVDYTPPAIRDVKFERCLADGTPDDDGIYLRVIGTILIASCKDKNSYTATVQYRLQGSSTWITAGAYTSGSAKIYNAKFTDNAYEVRLTVTDALRSSYASDVLDIGTVLYDFDPDAKNLEFLVPIEAPNHRDGIVDCGISRIDSTNYWIYRKWDSGYAELEIGLPVTPASSTAGGNIYFSDIISVALPFPVTSGVRITGVAGKMCYVANVDISADKNKIEFRLGRGTPIDTSASTWVNIRVSGFWK